MGRMRGGRRKRCTRSTSLQSTSSLTAPPRRLPDARRGRRSGMPPPAPAARRKNRSVGGGCVHGHPPRVSDDAGRQARTRLPQRKTTTRSRTTFGRRYPRRCRARSRRARGASGSARRRSSRSATARRAPSGQARRARGAREKRREKGEKRREKREKRREKGEKRREKRETSSEESDVERRDAGRAKREDAEARGRHYRRDVVAVAVVARSICAPSTRICEGPNRDPTRTRKIREATCRACAVRLHSIARARGRECERQSAREPESARGE